LFYWIYDISTETLAVLMTVLFVGFSWCGTIVIRPILRIFVRSAAGTNDFVGYILSCSCAFCGLLLGLIAVAAYQNHSIGISPLIQSPMRRTSAGFFAITADMRSSTRGSSPNVVYSGAAPNQADPPGDRLASQPGRRLAEAVLPDRSRPYLPAHGQFHRRRALTRLGIRNLWPDFRTNLGGTE
jgi:hypothetical protein